MSEKEMPAAEANSYELAFHVLPTVAEGEVATVFQKLKDIINKRKGELISEEAPARFDLAYEIIKYLEGRNRKFTSAYFGWIRFTADPKMIEKIKSDVEGTKELLRHMIIKLNRAEEENPFFFHEALAAQKSETIDLDEEEEVEEVSEEKPEEDEKKSEKDSKTEPEESETEKTEDDGEESAEKV